MLHAVVVVVRNEHASFLTIQLSEHSRCVVSRSVPDVCNDGNSFILTVEQSKVSPGLLGR